MKIQIIPARIGAYIFFTMWAAFMVHLLAVAKVTDYAREQHQAVAELTRSTAQVRYEDCLDQYSPDEKVECLLDLYDMNVRALEAVNEATR